MDLRDYQLQSLRSMLELEAAPGGLRDTMWMPLPGLIVDGSPAMYSPMLRVVQSAKFVPPLPKGGFLCEEMGLGKTVEVLALVLSNPAPANWVENGDPVATSCNSPTELLEDPSPGLDLQHIRTRCEYRSTATLVVCAVSLVGQWIEEARSKLDGDNRMRIHMYHGQKRIRDVKALAEDFDLVVTTYQTLASDRGKAGINHPLAQIEWYRIVLDEAHMAKSNSTAQSKACASSARRDGGRVRGRLWERISATSTASSGSSESIRRRKRTRLSSGLNTRWASTTRATTITRLTAARLPWLSLCSVRSPFATPRTRSSAGARSSSFRRSTRRR